MESRFPAPQMELGSLEQGMLQSAWLAASVVLIETSGPHQKSLLYWKPKVAKCAQYAAQRVP
jgi:hypothetical protein